MTAGRRCAAAVHGPTRYSDGCRCPAARARHRAVNARWRRRTAIAGGPMRVDATGTLRRLEALACLGWSRAHVQRLALTGPLDDIRIGRPVHRLTADRVAAVYPHLARRLGPSRVAAGQAAARGFFPPGCWPGASIDDPTAWPVPAPTPTFAYPRICVAGPAGRLLEVPA